ncbi:MAG: hypothetical protein [Bacteriophage sp.]|nr:MAG: hypothetical protein [Bacteriophage sp.]
MAEYINREKAKSLLHIEYAYAAEQLLDEIPAADVAPVVHGRWTFEPETENTLSMTKCNVCGWWTLDPSVDGVYKYCPNCGAKMDGGGEDAVD